MSIRRRCCIRLSTNQSAVNSFSRVRAGSHFLLVRKAHDCRRDGGGDGGGRYEGEGTRGRMRNGNVSKLKAISISV